MEQLLKPVASVVLAWTLFIGAVTHAYIGVSLARHSLARKLLAIPLFIVAGFVIWWMLAALLGVPLIVDIFD